MKYRLNNNHSSLIDNQLKEFIQMTGSLRGRAKSTRPRRQVKKAILSIVIAPFARESGLTIVYYGILANLTTLKGVLHRQHRHRASQPAVIEGNIWMRSTGVENIRQIRPFLQNKPNFPHFSPENDDLTQKQTQFKPNTNPIQTQLLQRLKMTVFTRKMSFTIVYCGLIVLFTTLKGADIKGDKPNGKIGKINLSLVKNLNFQVIINIIFMTITTMRGILKQPLSKGEIMKSKISRRKASLRREHVSFYLILTFVFILSICSILHAAPARSVIGTSQADRQLAEYFHAETAKLTEKCLKNIRILEQWENKRLKYRKQLFEMLGLDPLPEKTDLKPVITGRIEHDEFIVEKLHYQSMPGLYVTGNLYIPKGIEKPLPAILYVCGHGNVKKNNISYGSKVSYQRHPAWFARNGYVCLIIDTLQLGEIEGIHHGTYRYDMWWWNSRGYTSAGVEAWNCIRALDYLQSRKEVDKDRIGVTGRSGGGAYSWWIAALDERIKAAVPVAGITDLQNHVVDGCVEGHCDCMYIVNTYRWDYPLVAALVAPRPLLISNSDKDTIFPLDGVFRVHNKVREIYKLYGAEDKLGLHITEGPHKDTQELRVHAFAWFNRFLKGENPLIETPAVPFFKPEQLKVFDELPADEKNTKIQESFVPTAKKPSVPVSAKEWEKQRDSWMKVLEKKVFRGWPKQKEAGPLDVHQVFSVSREGIQLSAYDFTSQPHVRLRIYVASKAGLNEPEMLTLNILDEKGWIKWLAGMRVGFDGVLSDQKLPEPDKQLFRSIQDMLKGSNQVIAYMAPRGIGPDAWNKDERKQVQIRRRFMLLGQTADGMRVWDVRRAIQALRTIDLAEESPVAIQAEGKMAGIALYASLFEPDIAALNLGKLPVTHYDGPAFLNVLRFMDMPQAVAMTAERCKVRLYQKDGSGWQFPQAIDESLGWPDDKFQLDILDEDSDSYLIGDFNL